MAGRLSRGWSMAKASFAVLKQYPKLAILPAMSGAIFLLIVGAILASLMPQFGSAHSATSSIWKWLDNGQSPSIWFYLSAFVVLYVMTAVAIFFNVALIHCALRAHAGETPSIRGGLAAAVSLLPQILGWALHRHHDRHRAQHDHRCAQGVSRLPRRPAWRPPRSSPGPSSPTSSCRCW